MANDRDNPFDISEQDFTLDEILAEFGAHSRREGDLDVPEFVNKPRPKPEPPPAKPSAEPSGEKKVIRFPGSKAEVPPQPVEEPPAQPAAPPPPPPPGGSK